LSASLSGLAVATTYYWQVRAVNGGTPTIADGGIWWSFTTPPTTESWFGPNWGFRRAITVTNTTGSALNDYQLAVTLDSTFDFTKARPTGDDVRVTDASTTMSLPIWIEAWNPAARRARIWVRVPSVPAGGTTIYLYYGNAAAGAVGNAGAVFDIYDGFENATIGAPPFFGTGLTWTSTSAVTAVSDVVRQGSLSVRLQNFANATATFAPPNQGVVGAWMRRASTSSGDEDLYLYSNGALLATIGLGGSGKLHYWDGTFHDTPASWALNAWYLVTASFDTVQHRFTFTAYDANLVQVANVT